MPEAENFAELRGGPVTAREKSSDMLARGVTHMTIGFTGASSMNGAEPTELLKPLAYEYLAELNRMGLIEFIETVGTDGIPVLLAVIPHAKVLDGKIVETNDIVGKENPVPTEENHEKTI